MSTTTVAINKKIRVLFISRAYGREAGGMERLSYELLQSFRENKSVDAKFLVNKTLPHKSLSQNRINSILFSIRSIPQALKYSKKADIVHIGDPVLSMMGWLIHTIYGKPIIVNIHGLDVSYASKLYKIYLNIFFKKFSGYICISNFAKEYLLKWQVSGEITVIAPGLVDRFYDSTLKRKHLLKEYPLFKENNVILLTVGRLVARKGHAWFITNVLPHLAQNYHYVIIGTGPEKNNIIAAAQKSKLQNKVHLLGKLPDDQIKLFYNSADAFIQPNIKIKNDAEGFGIVLIEAASSNLPVLATNIDGIPSAIHNLRNGILLPPNKADTWIKTLNNLSNNFKFNSRDYTLSMFSWPRINQQYFSFFSAITKQSS